MSLINVSGELSFVSMIDVSNLDRWYSDCENGFTTYNEYVQLNERFVCIVQLKENMMSYQFDTFRIHVFIHNLQKCNQFEFRSEIRDSQLNFQLAPGQSKKLSFISAGILKIFDIETGECTFNLLSQNQTIFHNPCSILMGVGRKYNVPLLQWQ